MSLFNFLDDDDAVEPQGWVRSTYGVSVAGAYRRRPDGTPESEYIDE